MNKPALALIVLLLLAASCGPGAMPTPSPTTVATSTPAPIPTLGPAPKVDRVGFPEGYATKFQVLYMFDRPGNKQARVVYGNDKVLSRKPGEPYPYGSIIVIEHYAAKQDAQGNILKDANGRYVRDRLINLFAMRREPGFGADYQHLRTDEWEYAAYNTDGALFLPPERTAFCSACHQFAGAERDWVFRGDLSFTKDKYATVPEPGANEVSLSSISFYPATMSVKVGTRVSWMNNDMVAHTVTASDRSFDSGPLEPADVLTRTFTSPGTFEYICAIHPQFMRATVKVTR